MSRIAILEVKAFLVTLQTSNAEARTWLKAFQQAVIAYTKESRVSGKAVEASKAYFEASYVPLVDTILQAMDMSETLLAQYIQDFYSQVDATPDTYIDAELLQDVMADVRRLKREKERLAQSMGGGMGTTLQGQQQTYSMQLYEAMEEEKILEKYIAFEQSHTHFFAPFRELVHAVQRAVDALQNQVQFNAETGMYSVAKTFMPAMQRLQQSLNEARGIDPKREAQLEGYLLFKVPYTDSNGKEQAMWILEKDGVRVPNRELEAYLTRTGDYQDKAKYTILTLDELNEKIMKSWQNKTYYMDGKVYSGAAGSILKASAYVEDWEGQLSDAGVMDAITGVGLSLAAISGSMMYRGGSGTKANPKEINIHGKLNTELDEVDLVNKVIYEDKSAAKLYMKNPDFPQTEKQWAQKHIFKKGSNRLDALNQKDISISGGDSGFISSVDEIKNIKDYTFRIDADTPALRDAVQEQISNLQKKYPDYNFNAIYGGKK